MRLEHAPSTLQNALRENRDVLLETEGYALLASAGIEVPPHFFVPLGEQVDTAALAALDAAEVVVKVVSPQVLHKSDVGGVRMVQAEAGLVQSAIEGILDAVASAMPQAELRGCLVAAKLPVRANLPGCELLVSLRRDRAFGPVLMVGPGGLLTEWFGKLSGGESHLLFAAENFDAEAALAALRRTPFGRQALQPSRLFDTAPVQADSLAAALEGLAALATLQHEGRPLVDEIEMNPMASVDGRLVALDALVRPGRAPESARRPRPIATVGSLLHPRSVVVYGASASAQNAGRIILHNLKAAEGVDYGHLYAIHPKQERIEGVPCFRGAADLPEVVDLAVVSIPAPSAPDAIEDIVESGKARSIILIPGGFNETGDRTLQPRIQSALAASRDREDGGPVLVGGNCLGIVSKGEYNTFFLPAYKLPFHRAPGESLVVVSQSGAYLVTFTSNLDGIIYPRAAISYGNEMDLTASDFLEYYLEHEEEARVFAFYIEGFPAGEGERFLRLVRSATRDGRTVIVYKAGQTDAGAKAAASHTASVAGDYRVGRTLLQEAGAYVCQTLNQFEDLTKALTMLQDRRPRAPRVGVITNAGFEAGAVSDHLFGLEIAEFSPETVRALEEVLPSIAHCGNPVDCTPMTTTAQYARAVEIMAAADEVDCLIVSAVPATPALDVLAPDLTGQHPENAFGGHALPAELARVYDSMNKPMVVTIDSGRLYDPGALMLERAGVPVYRKIDRASRALAAFVRGKG